MNTLNEKCLLTCLLIGSLICPVISQGQYCLSGGPLSPEYENVEFVSILGENNTFISYTGCPGISGLNDLTQIESIDLVQGSTYELTVVFGTCSIIAALSAGEVWIDFNQDEIFDASESIGTWVGTPSNQNSVFYFTVPISAQNGQCRMRINQEIYGQPPLDPCATYSYGSSMDFGVSIGPIIDCSLFTGNDKSDPRIIHTIPYVESHSNSVCYGNSSLIYPSPDVFYRIIPSEFNNSDWSVSLCNSNFDTYLRVIDNNMNVIAENDDDLLCSPYSLVNFSSLGIDTLFIIVQGWWYHTGNYEISINDGSLLGSKELNSEISLFPNPCIEILNLRGIDESAELNLYSILGQSVLTNIKMNENSIDLSQIEEGSYILQVKFEGKSINTKLIIQ